MDYLTTQSQTTPKQPKVTMVPTAEELYALVKQRIHTKLQEQPYTDENGAWVDPLPAKDLGTLTGVIIKMLLEERKTIEQGQTSRIVPIPSLPPIKRDM